MTVEIDWDWILYLAIGFCGASSDVVFEGEGTPLILTEYFGVCMGGYFNCIRADVRVISTSDSSIITTGWREYEKKTVELWKLFKSSSDGLTGNYSLSYIFFNLEFKTKKVEDGRVSCKTRKGFDVREEKLGKFT